MAYFVESDPIFCHQITNFLFCRKRDIKIGEFGDKNCRPIPQKSLGASFRKILFIYLCIDLAGATVTHLQCYLQLPPISDKLIKGIW